MFRLFVVVLFLAAGAFAQADRATITGTVSDGTGAVVPNVEVAAVNTATRSTSRTASPSFSAERAQSITRAPSRPSATATARPSPVDDAVTRAAFPPSPRSILASFRAKPRLLPLIVRPVPCGGQAAPVKPFPAGPIRGRKGRGRMRIASRAPKKERKMDHRTILVVDDEPAITASLAYCLEQEGYRVVVASNGEEAVRLVMHEVPDLIVSDIMMPRVDGYELCRRIRTYYKTNTIPFLFLTAKTAAESKLKGMRLGSDDYITKPFDLSELLLKVRRILDRKPTLSDPAR